MTPREGPPPTAQWYGRAKALGPYSGASADFPGLDEVVVEVPRNLAGMGQVDVVLTVDGQSANPVPVHIQ